MISILNNANYLPHPKRVKFRGEIIYFRKCKSKDLFRIFDGFGISVSVLENLDKNMRYLIEYTDENNDRFYYMTSIFQFINSEKEFNNAMVDPQKMLSIKDMSDITKEVEEYQESQSLLTK